jgi:hypothetical protein
VGTGCEHQVTTGGGGDLREAQARLDRGQHESVIASSDPGALIGGAKESIDLRARQEADQRSSESFTGDGEDALDLRRVSRQLVCHVPKKGVDSGQAEVAAANSQAPLLLEVIEKGGDQRRIDVFEEKLAGRLVQVFLDEPQE